MHNFDNATTKWKRQEGLLIFNTCGIVILMQAVLLGGILFTLGTAAMTGIYLPFYSNIERIQVDAPKQKSRGMWANIDEKAKSKGE